MLNSKSLIKKATALTFTCLATLGATPIAALAYTVHTPYSVIEMQSTSEPVQLFNGSFFDVSGLTIQTVYGDEYVVKNFIDSDGFITAMEIIPNIVFHSRELGIQAFMMEHDSVQRTVSKSSDSRNTLFNVTFNFWFVPGESSGFNSIFVNRLPGGNPLTQLNNASIQARWAHVVLETSVFGLFRDTEIHSFTVDVNGRIVDGVQF